MERASGQRDNVQPGSSTHVGQCLGRHASDREVLSYGTLGGLATHEDSQREARPAADGLERLRGG